MPTTEVERLSTQLTASQQKLAEYEQSLGEYKRELSELERHAGEAIVNQELDGEDGQDVLSQLGFVEHQIKLLPLKITACRRRIGEQHKAVRRAQAAEKRAEADRKREESAELLSKTEGLLTALLEHEGVRYVPESPNRNGSVAGGVGLRGGAPEIIRVPTPRSRMLMLEAEALVAQAFELERGL